MASNTKSALGVRFHILSKNTPTSFKQPILIRQRCVSNVLCLLKNFHNRMSNHIGGGGEGISVKPQSFQKMHLDTPLEVKYLFWAIISNTNTQRPIGIVVDPDPDCEFLNLWFRIHNLQSRITRNLNTFFGQYYRIQTHRDLQAVLWIRIRIVNF